MVTGTAPSLLSTANPLFSTTALMSRTVGRRHQQQQQHQHQHHSCPVGGEKAAETLLSSVSRGLSTTTTLTSPSGRRTRAIPSLFTVEAGSHPHTHTHARTHPLTHSPTHSLARSPPDVPHSHRTPNPPLGTLARAPSSLPTAPTTCS